MESGYLLVNSLLKNQYKKYWIEDPVEHHKNIIGEYHVSSIGCNNQHLPPNKHAGPCLRQTFYVYVDPMENTNQTEGNFHIGRILHAEAQRIYRLNHDASIAEYPLGRKFFIDDEPVIMLGSMDITNESFSDKPYINYIDIVDFKTASDWTFPKDRDDKSPTHFNQVQIYAYIYDQYNLNHKYNIIRNLHVVYLAKHNLYTGIQPIKYDWTNAIYKYTNFINRIKYLHKQLKLRELPKAEPNKWCKFCDYRQRCYADVIEEKDVPVITIKEVEDLYMRETGKSPKWRGNYTKGFETYKYRFKVKT